MAEEVTGGGGGATGCAEECQQSAAGGCRKERRKAAKKEKRKQKRKEVAAKEREEEEARLNDPEELRRMQLEEEREKERLERERREFEEHERVFLEALAAKKKAEEEEEERRKALEDESKQNQDENSDDDWEYIEEGPPEIIWQGNEIIVKKKKVRVKRKDTDQQLKKEDPNRPTSNPLPPQSEAFADYKNGTAASAQQLLENVAQQVPNFGTEQDKAHCPFHLKTGACRFGSRCSRVHFYPDKSCTLLIKNMYSGPGLAWEQDEGLEYTEEEVERCYEEFYEDVHTEFLKFGEIVNFKVCKNGSSHLRGNVYIHYKSLDSALLAYQSINGRYFAGKQITCEFVSVNKWKVAICGEYMKSRLKTCSRGTACNFIHCFRNPGGDYEWADMDRPPPRYWEKKMGALFGYLEDSGYDNHMEREGRNSSKTMTADPDRYNNSRRSRSRERERDSSRSRHDEYDARRSRHQERHTSWSRKAVEVLDEKNHGERTNPKSNRNSKNRTHGSDSDGDWSRKDGGGDRTPDYTRGKGDKTHDSDFREEDRERHHRHTRKRSRHSNEGLESIEEHGNSVKKNDKHKRKESDSEKFEPQRMKKRRHSSRDDRSSMEPSEATFSGEFLKSDRDRTSVRHQASFRDSSSDETESTSLHSRRSKSHDSGYYSDEEGDKRGRWESEKTGAEKHRTSERKLIADDFDRYGGNPNSHDQDSDERDRESRWRGSGQSSSWKSSDGLEELGSAEESEEKQKRHRRKHRTHGHKQHHKKTG